jgi:hypothetical protein
MAKLMHKRTIILHAGLPACDPFEPVSEKFIESSVLTPGFLTGKLDVRLVGGESNILSHDSSVHEIRVTGKLKGLNRCTVPMKPGPEGVWIGFAGPSL